MTDDSAVARTAADPAQAAFDRCAAAWQSYAATPLGALRRDLVLARLTPRLASLGKAPLSILDAGAGSGEYALALARLGHAVTLLDYAPAMLAAARDAFAAEPADVQARATFRCAPLDNAAHPGAPPYDAVLVHTVLEYIPDPCSALQALLSALRPGGLISLLLVNPVADALRYALAGDLARAEAALTQPVASDTLFGLPRHALDADALCAALAARGVTRIERFGVRVVADYLPAALLTDVAARPALLRLEQRLAALEPYRGIARYQHVLGLKSW